MAGRSDFWNPTLNIEYVHGPCDTFLYSHLQWMNFHPTNGIILHFSTHTVKIYGRNLKTLYAEFLELKCRNITIVEKEHDLLGADAVVVHAVKVKQVDNRTPGKHGDRDGPTR